VVQLSKIDEIITKLNEIPRRIDVVVQTEHAGMDSGTEEEFEEAFENLGIKPL